MRNLFKVVIIGIICFIVSKYVISFCIIHGDSMYPTYEDKDIVLENKLDKKYVNGDIVVVKKNNLKIVKRIVGCPFDKLNIENGYLYVNDIKYDDLFIGELGLLKDEITLKKDEYFVLGDNRNQSIDSRFEEIGIIKRKEIIGKIIN